MFPAGDERGRQQTHPYGFPQAQCLNQVPAQQFPGAASLADMEAALFNHEMLQHGIMAFQPGPAPLPAGAGHPSAATNMQAAQARERNRQAQQRFRERQRAKREQAAAAQAEMDNEMQQLTLQNEALQTENKIMEKVLAVREAMLRAFVQTSSGSGSSAGEGSSAAAGDAEQLLRGPGNELARAIGDLAPQHQAAGSKAEGPASFVERAGSGSPGTAAAANSPAGDDGVDGAFDGEAPTSLLRAHSQSGAAAALDGTALRALPTVPPLSDVTVASAINAMTSPTQLVDYWREWTIDLKAAWEEAAAAQFDAASEAGVEQVMDTMTQIWWHAAHLKPSYLTHLSYAALPTDQSQQAKWAAIAARILPEMRDSDVALMRRAWHAYSKRLAKTAVGAQQWVEKLRRLEASRADAGMHSSAVASLELAEICAHVARSVQQEYEASMEFIGSQAPATTSMQKAFMNYASIPHMPDVVAIVYHILKLAQTGTTLVPTPAAPTLLAPPPAPSQTS